MAFVYKYKNGDDILFTSYGQYYILSERMVLRLNVICEEEDCDKEKAATFFSSFELNRR